MFAVFTHNFFNIVMNYRVAFTIVGVILIIIGNNLPWFVYKMQIIESLEDPDFLNSLNEEDIPDEEDDDPEDDKPGFIFTLAFHLRWSGWLVLFLGVIGFVMWFVSQL